MAFSREVKEAVLRRSSGLCERKLPNGQRCLALGAEFHHIVLRSRHGKRIKKLADSEENCMLICLTCHRNRHDGVGWNADADSLVPGADFRLALREGGLDGTKNI